MPKRSSKKARRILLLGGSIEAMALDEELSRDSSFFVINSLAGRLPHLSHSFYGDLRIGGFGGRGGLIGYLRQADIDCLIDATHPFASKISRNAYEACKEVSIPYMLLFRKEWRCHRQDIWLKAKDIDSAFNLLLSLPSPSNIFLTLGSSGVDFLSRHKEFRHRHNFIIRAMSSDIKAPSLCKLIISRPPFGIEQELSLLKDLAVDYIVSKNSGGDSVYAKVIAARLLSIPIIMIDRPSLNLGPCFEDVKGIMSHLRSLF